MHKKLTLTIDEEVYNGLHQVIGPRNISHFIEELVRPFVLKPELASAYEQMAKDTQREQEAFEWAETTFGDSSDEAR